MLWPQSVPDRRRLHFEYSAIGSHAMQAEEMHFSSSLLFPLVQEALLGVIEQFS